MKVLLINPPYSVPFIREGRCQSPQEMRKNSIPQMTLAYLAGILEKEKHDIKVYDCIALGKNETNFFQDLGSFRPGLFIVNTTTPTINSDLLFVDGLKRRYPEALTAVFGPHVTALHKEILQEVQGLDLIIRNEPEFVVRELPEKMKNGQISGAIAGCTVRMNGEIKIFPDRDHDPDLDKLGFPAWKYLPLNQYIHPVLKKTYLTVNVGRGCKHKCIFCVAPKYYGETVRYRSVKSVLDEIRNNKNEFDVRHFWFYADDFTADTDYVKDLCQSIIVEKLNILWWSNTRVDKPDKEMFNLMKKSGCIMLSLGGESGSSEILRRMRKGTRTEQIIKTVRLLRKIDIQSVLYFLIGLPGETIDTIRKTIDFAKTVNPDFVEFYPATPYPGTEFYDIAKQQQMIIRKEWSSYQYNEFVVQIPGLSNAGLEKLLKRAYRDFYLRPSYLFILTKKLKHPLEFIRLLRFGFSYLKRLFS